MAIAMELSLGIIATVEGDTAIADIINVMGL